MEGRQEVTDEPEAPPSEHTLDALRYMMEGLRRGRALADWREPWFSNGYMRPIEERERTDLLTGKWSDEFHLTDEQMKVFGMDVGAVSKGAIYVTTWTPEGLRYTEIPTADFYMPDPRGGNIGGNGSEDT